MYEKELKALQRANRVRKRKVFDNDILDFASNDYLGFAEDKKLFTKAYKKVLKNSYYSPKASILVNGYSDLHKNFEENLAKFNNFESAISVGSGFLANISMIEALIRRGDTLFIDNEYHASGILATKLTQAKVIFFEHNNIEELETLLKNNSSNRVFIAIEGIYSMSGDLAEKEIFDLADRYNSILIVDEAHSSGVVGNNLLGVFDFYNIKPKKNHIKMGTLGKAYGSYGAYILASNEIITFLENRAKPIIYSTALSLFDIALGDESLNKIVKKSEKIKVKIKEKQLLAKEILNINIDGLILSIKVGNNQKVLEIQKKLLEEKYLIGAIRPPTVESAILRVILRISNSNKTTKKLLNFIKTEIEK